MKEGGRKSLELEKDWEIFKNRLELSHKAVFGRELGANEDFSIYKRIVVARTVDDEAMKVCQDGGIVTSLLISMLEEGII